jgi:hypothetical protein
MTAPLLSLCIPTWNRSKWVKACLEASLPQAERFPGLVEVVVSDNASPDDTWTVLQAFAAKHPCLRVHRNPENNYTENFNTVLRVAKGRYAWLMGDDDAPMPGALARVLELLQKEPHDLYLLHAQEATLDEQPLGRREWLRPPLPKLSWDLTDPADYKAYLNQAQYMAAAFGFLSVLVVDREAFLEGSETRQEFSRMGWPHVANGLHMVQRKGRVRVVPETLVWNRQQDEGPQTNPWGRIMHDLRGWVRLAETFFPEDRVLRKAFLGVMRSNHDGRTPLLLRQTATTEEAWMESKDFLLRGGYATYEIEAVEMGFRLLQAQYPLSPALEQGPMVLVDLPRFMRGAQRAVVVALGALDHFLEAQPMLSALRARGVQVKVLCRPGHGELLDGFDVMELPLDRLYADPAYRASISEALSQWEPDLGIHADALRDVTGDLLLRGSGAVVLVAPEAQERPLQPQEKAILDAGFHVLVPAGDDWRSAMLSRLGLSPGPSTLWAGSEASAEAEGLRSGLPEGPWMALLGDDLLALQKEDLPAMLESIVQEGAVVLGLGGGASAPLLSRLLAPYEDRSCMLAGSLSLAATAAVLSRCQGYVAGGIAFQAMAKAVGLQPHPVRLLHPSR